MKTLTIAILALTATTTFTPLEAQEKKVFINFAAGITLPQGDLADRVSTGWHGLATVNLSSPTQVYGLRFDVAHNRFGYDDQLTTALGKGRESTTSATINLTYRLPLNNAPISPYLITGLGAYVTECSQGPACDAQAHYGWNIGLGTKLYVLGVQSFLEARFHRTGHRGQDVHYLPITLGITL
jgi:hypothetical protein